MALDFGITFVKNTQLDFEDLSDYTGLTVTRTVLEVTHPTIADNELVEVELYDENVASLGDDLEIDTETYGLDSLIDGTYKFRLVAYNGATEVASSTKYINQWYFVKSKRRSLMEQILNDECSSDFCLAGKLNAMMKSADDLADNTDYLKSQEIASWLVEKVQKNSFLNG